MAVTVKSQDEINRMRDAGKILAEVHEKLEEIIKPGITTLEIDRKGEEFIRNAGCIPSFKGYEGYPASICVSINDEVVHGFPSNRKLKKGDIITIDIGACYKGYHGDSAWTYKVGEITPEEEALLKNTEESLFIGLAQIKPGNRIGDIGNAIEQFAKKNHLGVVKELCGHGVGTTVHESPDVPNYGKAGTGPLLREGMVIAVEPMLTLGSPSIYIEDNDWTVVTQDHSPSAHYEHTVVVTKDGYEILTGE